MKKILLFSILAILLAQLSMATMQDVSAPLISAISVVGITKTNATIIWKTDERANSMIAYGLNVESDTGLVLNHTMNLSGLKPATLYAFNVTSCDPSGNCASASGQSLTFATTGYRAVDLTLQQSNLTRSLTTSVTNITILNFSEQNPAHLSIDSKEGLYFVYNGSEYAFIFPKQTDANTTVRLMPWNHVDILPYGDTIYYDLNNDSSDDMMFRINSVKKSDAQTQDLSIKYVKYRFDIDVMDLNSPAVNKTEEPKVKFDVNPKYEPKYEPPVKEGEISILSSIITQRKVSILTGIVITALVFIATLFVILLAKGYP